MNQITLKWLFFQETAKIAQRLGALPPDPMYNTLKLHQFVQHAQLQQFLNRIMLSFDSSLLEKSWLQLQGFIVPVDSEYVTCPP